MDDDDLTTWHWVLVTLLALVGGACSALALPWPWP
jgi:hypothetical protein